MKRIAAVSTACIAAALMFSCASTNGAGGKAGKNAPLAEDAPDYVPALATPLYKFDLGGNGAAAGWTAVSAKDAYSKEKGYGFNTPDGVQDVAAPGQNELSDAVQFVKDSNETTNSDNTFNVDLPNGLYEIAVWSGDSFRQSVCAEGHFQIMDLTGKGNWDVFQIPVTDGQLNIFARAGKPGTNFSLSAITIAKISDDTTLPPTVWFCGDSTVCRYYPDSNSPFGVQYGRHGWGQDFKTFIKDSWAVRDMATGGQTAEGFFTSGQHETVKTYIKKGDYYIIGIGINDQGRKLPDQSYKMFITQMVKDAKAVGAIPVLVGQQGRKGDLGRGLPGRWYNHILEAVAKEQGVQYINLFKLFDDYKESLARKANGADLVAELYANEDLHISPKGAKKCAQLIASQLPELAK
ncbi:MAG: hypothetical protein K6G80_02995 [Treponema sp.]|nr:hypothetical protein [Treponema sp.]